MREYQITQRTSLNFYNRQKEKTSGETKTETIEKIAENGEAQLIKTQVLDGKNIYEVGLEITKDGEVVKNKLISLIWTVS